jgi:putative transcriptional regulator
MAILIGATDERVLMELGERLARHRLNQNLTQGQLAREAGVSKRTVVRLENGQSGQLTNLLRVLRALGLLGNLDALVPGPLASPIEALKAKRKERRRASPGGKKPKTNLPWTWGDEPARSGGAA